MLGGDEPFVDSLPYTTRRRRSTSFSGAPKFSC